MNQPVATLERKFSGLVTKIEEGDCVLVLGPRISVPRDIAGSDIPIDEYLAGKLREDLGEEPGEQKDLRRAIARYEREKSASACRSLVQELVSDFNGHTTDLHLDLAALPFRLILSATPDRMMANALRSRGKADVREAYYDYCPGSAANMAFTLPSADEPIVYSLFGRHDHPESMVLNDKNLLDYLVKITRESPALPDVVRATLRAPSTVFLFVGFGFTNWWLRLLLKVLDVTGVENRGLSLALEDASTFDVAAATENKGFFESVGIYIQARDWNALAKELAAKIHQSGVTKAAAHATLAGGTFANSGRPLVFLSYASEDADKIDSLSAGLQQRGVSVWQDKQNLRAGQDWDEKITRMIKGVDFFVFVQTEKMDERDHSRQSGVYNRELKRALERVEDMPYATTFVLHVTMGVCRSRPEPQLSKLHRIAVDTEAGTEQLALAIIASYQQAIDDSGVSSAARAR